jgi:TRAP-type C4-dicarboxylate transport system permease small subunit
MSSEQTSTGNAALAKLAALAVAIAGVALCGVAAVEGWQVVARYVFNNSPSWTEPVALLLMSTTMMFGAAAGVRAEAHFGFFIAADSAPAPIKFALRIVARVIIAAIGVMLAGQGGYLMADAWSFDMAGVPLPQGVVFMPICFGGALIALFACERLWIEIQARRRA